MNKIFSVIMFILLFVVLLVPNTSFGVYDITKSGTDISKYKTEGGEESTIINEKAGTIVGIIRLIGTIVSVGALMVIGIKYIISSVDEKAEYKKTFILYIIGAFLVFTVTLLPEVIYNITKEL